MLRTPSILVSLCVAVLAGCAKPAAPEPSPADTPAPEVEVPPKVEAAREDARVLYETLQSAHYNLYAHVDREVYDQAHADLLAELGTPLGTRELAAKLIAFGALARLGHSHVAFPVPEYFAYVKDGGTLLPFDVRPTEDGVWIAHSYHEDIPVGAELVALDGTSAQQWVDTLGRYVPAENTRFRNAQLETMFPRHHWLHGAVADTHTLELTSGEEAWTVTVDSLPGLDIEMAKSEWETQGQVREARLLDGGVGYLRQGPSGPLEGETLADVVAFYDEAFASFLEADVSVVILDLRDNPGGDNSYSDPMVAWVADEPFAWASDYRVKASETTRGVLAGYAASDPDGISARILSVLNDQPDGTEFSFPIDAVPPRDDGFEGEVWALINRHSYSNATVTAAVLQDYGFARIAGEETTDLPTSYASSAQFTLPNSGMTVVYPKGWFARPSGVIDDRGVIPDLALPPAPVVAEGDPVLDALLDHIRAE